eukprot:6210311-Pleurochrysis_carterae.AAC.1
MALFSRFCECVQVGDCVSGCARLTHLAGEMAKVRQTCTSSILLNLHQPEVLRTLQARIRAGLYMYVVTLLGLLALRDTCLQHPLTQIRKCRNVSAR